MAEMEMLQQIIGEKNLERGIESVNESNRMQMASNLADGNEDVTEVDAYDMIKDMENRTIEQIQEDVPGIAEPALRMIAQYSLMNYLQERE